MLLIGIAAVGIGLWGSLSALAELYQGMIDAPLEQADDAEGQTVTRMITFAAIGVGGLVPLVMGRIFLKRDRIRARRRAQQER